MIDDIIDPMKQFKQIISEVHASERERYVIRLADEAITSWMTTQSPLSMIQYLGMTPAEYATFMFDPHAWARDFLAKVYNGQKSLSIN